MKLTFSFTLRVVLVIFLALSLSIQSARSEQTSAEWTQAFGGSGYDAGSAVIQTSDGGFAVASSTTSYGAGGGDFWLLKTNASGAPQWNKTYGGTAGEVANALIKTDDDGYLLAGYVDPGPNGSYDGWLVKTDSSGNMLWNKTYGGPGNDQITSLVQANNGYALAGFTNSSGSGGSDCWLIKTDSLGNVVWDKTYGGAGNERANALVNTGNGFVLAGSTNSSGAGNNDMFLVKTDSSGILQWNKTYGGSGGDVAHGLIMTADGGFALTGIANSAGLFTGEFGLVKTDASGNQMWNNSYGGLGEDDEAFTIVSNSAGYALAGATNAFGAGSYDVWLVQTDTSGKMLWNTTYGGSGGEGTLNMIQTNDGSLVIAGYTTSYGAGGYDVWLIKVNPSAIPEFPQSTVIAAVAVMTIVVAVIAGRKLSKRGFR